MAVLNQLRIGAKLPPSGFVPDVGPLTELARIGEDSGFDGLWVSDHVVMPREVVSRYPFSADGTMTWEPEAPWIDCLVAMAAAAAVTESAEIGVGVLIVPMRNPLVLAKQLASLDVISNGRVVVGVGAGWLREEFEALHADFDARGAMLDEWIQIMRGCWTGEPPAKPDGHYPVPDGLLCHPTPVREPPILVGGMSAAALRRVAVGADGWFALQNANEIDAGVLAAGMATIRAEAARVGRPPPGRLAMRLPGPTPVAASHLGALVEAGVTDIVVDVDWSGDGPRRTVEVLRAALP